MKKIGIITHYYKSRNYGGNLQAYALCKVLQKNGYDAEQICFPRIIAAEKKNVVKNIFSIKFPVLCYRKVASIIRNVLVCRENAKYNIDRRRENAFARFNSVLTPHSNRVYNSSTVSQCADEYDAFITGSDQVWNLFGDPAPYFLNFVPSDKIKISYAASIARDSLTDEQKELFKRSLKDYKAISVREKSAKNLLAGLAPIEVETVLDPTLILTREEWDDVASERLIPEDYVFCYFLGNNKKERRLAEKFARLHKLKLVAIPHTSGIKLIDRNFGDKQLYDASPENFISLIKHAKYIFTDSFHAVVFSNIYEKEYFVFNRSAKGEMSSRITDITDLFNQSERFCAGKKRETIDYISSLRAIDYSQKNADFEDSKRKSLDFLKTGLED